MKPPHLYIFVDPVLYNRINNKNSNTNNISIKPTSLPLDLRKQASFVETNDSLPFKLELAKSLESYQN